MHLKIRQCLYNLLRNRKQIFGFLVKVAEKILQKEILNNKHLTLNKQWETPNPIKVNRVPKAPQVQMIQSSA